MAEYACLSDSTAVTITAIGKRIRHRDRKRIKPIAYYAESCYEQYYELLRAGHFAGRCRISHSKLSKKMAAAYDDKNFLLFLTILNKIKKLYGVTRLSNFHNICKNCGAKT